MKRISIVASLLLMSAAAMAQVKPGFFVAAGVRTNDVVETPTIGGFEGEAGYMFKHIGFSVVGYTNSKFQTEKVLAYGAKVYVPIAHVDAITFTAAGEALYLDNERRAWRKWAFTPSFGVGTPIIGRLSGEFSVLAFIHREVFKAWRETPGAKGIIDRWRVCNPGGQFKFIYSIGKKNG